MDLVLAVVAFLALAIAALASVEMHLPRLFAVAKPATTLSLLLVVGFPPEQRFGMLVCAGIALCVLGDVALLSERGDAFMIGLFLFLLAHVSYTAAFVVGAGDSPVPAAFIGMAVMTVASVWLMRRIWAGVDPPLKIPAAVYAVAITVMVGAAYLVMAGPWPERIGLAAVAGAVLFYVGDATLAWSRFHAPFRHDQTMNLTFYWLGQLGIALAARWVAQG